MYDPALGRWHSIDPSAERYYRYTPYHYCYNDPINYIDPIGSDVVQNNGNYQITGADVYQYYAYLQSISEGKGSMDNLYEALGKAAKSNKGQGGPMATTIGAVNVYGNQLGQDNTYTTPYGQRFTTKEYSRFSGHENHRAKDWDSGTNIDNLLPRTGTKSTSNRILKYFRAGLDVLNNLFNSSNKNNNQSSDDQIRKENTGIVKDKTIPEKPDSIPVTVLEEWLNDDGIFIQVKNRKYHEWKKGDTTGWKTPNK